MRWPRAWLIGTALLAPVAGCRSCDQVERALRAREIELRETKEELERQQAINHGLQFEINAARCAAAPPGTVIDPATPIYPVRSLALGRQTGGLEGPSGVGDQALQVVVQPLDADNSTIKVPGSLLVQAIEINADGLKRPLSTWEVSPEQLCHTWRDGFLTTGYVLSFPWKVWPSTEKLRVVVQMRLQDGRLFEAERDVTLHLPSPSHRRIPPPMPPPEPVGTPPVPPEPLPPPQPVDGPTIETSKKPRFNEVQRLPVAIPNWIDPTHSEPPPAATTQMLPPVAREN
jgi:hypothetical protein